MGDFPANRHRKGSPYVVGLPFYLSYGNYTSTTTTPLILQVGITMADPYLLGLLLQQRLNSPHLNFGTAGAEGMQVTSLQQSSFTIVQRPVNPLSHPLPVVNTVTTLPRFAHRISVTQLSWHPQLLLQQLFPLF